MAQNIQLFGPCEGFLTHQWIITGCVPSCGPETRNTTDSETAGKCKLHKYFESRHYLRSPDHIGNLGNLIFQVWNSRYLTIQTSYQVVRSSFESFSVDPAFISNIKLTNVLPCETIEKMKAGRKTRIFCVVIFLYKAFFQSWKYFSNEAVCIRDVLVIRPNYLSKAKQILKQMVFQSKTLIGVHVRRTDMMMKGSQKIGRIVARPVNSI